MANSSLSKKNAETGLAGSSQVYRTCDFFGGSQLFCLDEIIDWIFIQFERITVHLYTLNEVKGGKREFLHSLEVAKDTDEEASSQKGSDSGEEEVEGEGGVESEPKSAAASDVEDDDLPTHLQQVFVDEFAR